MVVGCMRNSWKDYIILVKIYVRMHYLWYYLKNPSMYLKMNKLRIGTMNDGLKLFWMIITVTLGLYIAGCFMFGIIEMTIYTFIAVAIIKLIDNFNNTRY